MASAVSGALEIIPGRLYYMALRSGPSENAKLTAHFWSSDEFVYLNFFLDWGPLSLGNLYRFCRVLNFKLGSGELKGKAICVYSGAHAYKRANAAFLLSSWLLLYNDKCPEEAFAPFRTTYPSFPPFHDATPCVCTYELNIPHCLRGLERACHFGFFDFNKFSIEEYEHYEQVENGDMNWIVDGKFLAFAGPHDRSEMTMDGYRTLTPRNYIPYFKKHNVTLVVRLNKKYYDKQMFLDAGIGHLEAYFVDGSTPSPPVLRHFLAACESTPGAIAVHCKAGLGRTGTCIGCYLMKHFGFSAAEVIGWMRVCRPGSVIGPQQQYLKQMERAMHREGSAFRRRTGTSSSAVGGETVGAGNRSSTDSARELGLPPRWSSHGDAQLMATAAEAGEYSKEGGKEGPRTANDSDLSGTSGGKGGASGTSRWLSASSPPPKGSGYRETSPRPLNPEKLVSGQRRHNSIGVVRATTGQNAHQGPLSQSSSPVEHGVKRVNWEFMQLGLGSGGAVQPGIPRTQSGTRRASAPPERRPEHRARAGQRGTGSSVTTRSNRVLERLAIATASLAAAAEEAEEASHGDLSRQSRPNCVVPSTDSSDVWEESAGGSVLSERTQGDLLRRQRARGVASDPVGR